MSVPEILATLTVAARALGVTVPVLSDSYRTWKLTAAARDVAAQMHRVRMEALANGLNVGLQFKKAPDGGGWQAYLDGGTRGIRASEIASGIDTPLGENIPLVSTYPGVRIGIPPGAVPRIPPRRGVLSPGDDPIAFGNSDIFSASPTGGTSGGTLYLTDGEDLRGVVVYGPTGRIRIWRYDADRRLWQR